MSVWIIVHNICSFTQHSTKPIGKYSLLTSRQTSHNRCCQLMGGMSTASNLVSTLWGISIKVGQVTVVSRLYLWVHNRFVVVICIRWCDVAIITGSRLRTRYNAGVVISVRSIHHVVVFRSSSNVVLVSYTTAVSHTVTTQQCIVWWNDMQPPKAVWRGMLMVQPRGEHFWSEFRRLSYRFSQSGRPVGSTYSMGLPNRSPKCTWVLLSYKVKVMGQTDRQTDGRSTVLLNAPVPWRGHNYGPDILLLQCWFYIERWLSFANNFM